MDLQKLGHKAFPSLEGRDFDRMLKERFFQHPVRKKLSINCLNELVSSWPTYMYTEEIVLLDCVEIWGVHCLE